VHVDWVFGHVEAKIVGASGAAPRLDAGSGQHVDQIAFARGELSAYFGLMKFRVLIEPDEDGVFVAECPSLPGCISQGATRAEAVINIQDAISGYLESLKKHGEAVPLPITEEIVEVAL